jgi:TonB family protein
MAIDLLAGNIAAHWVQAGLLAASALVAICLLNLNEPRARLAALHVTLVAIVLLPLLQPWMVIEPALEVASSAVVSSAAPVHTLEAAQGGIEATSWPDPSLAIVTIVMAGVGMRLLWLFAGIIRLSRFSGQTPTALPPAVAEDFEAALGVSACYIQQTGSRGPWTFGFLRPTIALPAGFDALVPAFQRAVICHELVHIKRRDIAVAFIEELAVAALWFHPWMWLLRARIRVAREQVVDSRVVTMLGNREDYVRCLVDLSGHDLAPHFSQAGAGMLRPRELRARVDVIFQEVHMSRMRFAVAASSFVAVTIATGLMVVAAMPLRAASQTAPDAPRKQINRVYPEYPHDSLERGIKGVVIVDITVNAAGDVTSAAVVGGPQELHASALKAAYGIKYTKGSSSTAMQITFEYVLTGTTWGVKIGEALPNMGLRPAQNAQAWDDALSKARRALEALEGGPQPDATGAYRIGGGLMPPKKIKDARPQYPAIAQQARVQGVVILEVRIEEHGNVSDAKVLRSIPLLDQAALEAVKQWQYTPTLLNGVAVPILMTVTVNFSLTPQVTLRINMPDGTLVVLHVRPNGGIGRTEHPAMSRYGFAPFVDDDPSVEMVKVAIYELDEAGVPPRPLANVELKPGGEIVYSASSPSFGIQLIGVTR